MKIIIRDLQKKTRLNPKRIKNLVLKVLSSEGIKRSGEITICFINAKHIQALNLKFLGRNHPTDVIAFKLKETRRELFADIVVSTDAAVVNAREFRTSALEEAYLYVVHGLLHILGYKDNNSKQRRIMQAKAESILTYALKTRSCKSL